MLMTDHKWLQTDGLDLIQARTFRDLEQKLDAVEKYGTDGPARKRLLEQATFDALRLALSLAEDDETQCCHYADTL